MLGIRSVAATLLAGLMPAMAFGPAAGSAARGQQRHAAGSGAVVTAAFELSARQHYGRPANASGFSVILTTGGAQAAWVFGGTNPGGPSTPVADQWTGGKLAPSRLPARLTGFITDACATSADDVWAASEYGHYVLHWNGQGWQVARRWPGGHITGLAALSADNVWVFGTGPDGTRGTGTWHFNGTSWTHLTGPSGTIYRASAIAWHDIWAISASQQGQAILWQHAGQWRQVPTGSALDGVQLRDILAISNADVWVLGDTVTATGTVMLAMAHWNGRGWSRVPMSLDAWAGRLAVGPDGDVLATATPSGAAAAGLILQVSPHGVQAEARIQAGDGSGVSDVTQVPGTRGELWASGGVLTARGSDAAIWTGSATPLARRTTTDGLAAWRVLLRLRS